MTNQAIIKLFARLVKAELQFSALQKHCNAAMDDPQRIFQLISKQSEYLRLGSQRSILKNPFGTPKQSSIYEGEKNKENQVETQNYIEQDILLKRMKQFSMEIDINDAGMLIELYDRSDNNRISYVDFLYQLLGIE